MSERSPFPGLMPGFDFLQGLVRQAGAALPLPGMSQWIAPTLDPEELDKRISELRTVQFWLEQNARLLATTIQALEVQRMTLATLKTMNVSMGDLRDAMSIPPAPAADEPASTPAAATEAEASAARPAGMVDPMQWWGALTQQFGQIAAQAMQEAPSAAPAAASAARPTPAPRPAAPRPAPAAARPAAPRKAAPRKKPAPR